MYEIESIAAPSRAELIQKARVSAFPFDKLEVGQSFFVPDSKPTVQIPAKAASDLLGRNFKVARDTKGDKTGRRVYRVADTVEA